jgi:hypothetical protein
MANYSKIRREPKFTLVIKDEDELDDTLKKFSVKYGGAWVHSIIPFTHTTYFYQFANPSSVPDEYHDHTHNRMAYKGIIREFTHGAIIREQNRGLGCQ